MDESSLSRATLGGFQQTRYMTQRLIWTRSIVTGSKFAIFSGLFTGIELGLSYYRGYWDAFNPLIAGTGAGILYATPLSTLPESHNSLFGVHRLPPTKHSNLENQTE